MATAQERQEAKTSIFQLFADQCKQHETTVAALVAELENGKNDARFLRQQYVDVQEQLTKLQTQLLASERERNQLRGALEYAESELEKLRGENERLKEQGLSDGAELDSIRAMMSQAVAETSRNRGMLVQQHRNHESIRTPRDEQLQPTPTNNSTTTYNNGATELRSVHLTSVSHRNNVGESSPAPLHPSDTPFHRQMSPQRPPHPFVAFRAGSHVNESEATAQQPRSVIFGTNNNHPTSPGSGSNFDERYNLPHILRVDAFASRGLSISHYGHVAVSGSDLGPAYCVYTEGAGSGDIHVEVSVKSYESVAVVVGVTAMSWVGGDGCVASLSALPTKCCLRGDGSVILTCGGGNVETRLDLPKTFRTVSIRYEAAIRRLTFSVNGTHTSGPVQLPEDFAHQRLCPIVALPCRGDEAIVRLLH